MKKKILFIVFLIFLQNHGFSLDKDKASSPFSGTLLGFYAENVEPGNLLFQPFLFITRDYGIYDENSSLVNDRNIHEYMGLVTLETGVTKKIDITLNVSAAYDHTSRGNAFSFGDISVNLGFAISKNQKDSWIPDFRVILSESFPTGKYDQLDPLLEGGDGTGIGAYGTFLIFAARKLFYRWPNHPYNININLIFGTFSHVDIKGFSVYGGGDSTEGDVKPGEEFIGNIGFEYKFNYHWGVGIDIRHEHQNSTSFSRANEGIEFSEQPSLDLFSLAPMLEYNINKSASVLGGVWFSVFGRNAEAFYSGIISYSYEF